MAGMQLSVSPCSASQPKPIASLLHTKGEGLMGPTPKKASDGKQGAEGGELAVCGHVVLMKSHQRRGREPRLRSHRMISV